MNGETDKSLEEVRKLLSACVDEVSKRVVGQQPMIMGILMAVIADGHVLLEGVPGLAKTLVVKTVAEVIGGQFKRIQFTPDLLPADIIGTMIYRQQTGEFVPRRGPIFSNVILADEINRAPAKVQSALLEAMQERQVTIGDSTYPLDRPFLVLATQNPIEHEGTYALPEAQLDRFIMKIRVTYPSLQEEIEIVRLVGVERNVPVERVLSREQLFDLREAASRVRVDSRIEEYIVSLVAASREKERSKADFIRFIEYGASPRASIYLYRCAKIRALFEGRSFIVPEDVKAVAPDVMRHRIILTYEAESEELTTDDILSEILAFVRVP